VSNPTRAADILQIINERPWTITVYREVDHTDVQVDTFTGRIDEISRRSTGLEAASQDGPVSIQAYLLTCPSDHRTVQARDVVVGVDEDGQEVTFRTLFVNDYGYKAEAILERIE